MVMVKSATPRAQLADILRRAGTRVLDAGGVITDITSFGTRPLAYEFKSPGERHFEAHMVQISFNSAPTLIEDMKHDMRTDERVLRWIAVKKKALRPLSDYKARDPRNLNLPAATTTTKESAAPKPPTQPVSKYPLFSEERKERRNARRKAAARGD